MADWPQQESLVLFCSKAYKEVRSCSTMHEQKRAQFDRFAAFFLTVFTDVVGIFLCQKEREEHGTAVTLRMRVTP